MVKQENEDNKEIIVVEVLRGTNKPYYIKSKGMTIDGVFVRLGATVQHATKETIREMIMESSGISFEKNISINQDLTFTFANQLFKKKKISFGNVEKKNLGLINSDNKYTNLGLLLSDECPYSITEVATLIRISAMERTDLRSLLTKQDSSINSNQNVKERSLFDDF